MRAGPIPHWVCGCGARNSFEFENCPKCDSKNDRKTRMNEDSKAVELYRRYRPTKFSEVVGQKEAVQTLMDMGKRGVIPHSVLFTGPSGCGKTTLARILRTKLKCSDYDFTEVNAADFRGIDSIRDIREHMGAAPMSGECRVWLIDEIHQQTGAAQDSFLKMLEDTPSHVYFLLATTDPHKLKKTIITRCTEIRCKPISETDLIGLVKRVSEAEGKTLEEKVMKRIVQVSEGSARKCLVVLHAVIGLATLEEQMKAIESCDIEGQAFELARILMNEKARWGDVKEILNLLQEEDAEGLRRMILGYCKSVLLKSGNARAAMIIEEFREPLFTIGMPGLVASCFNITNPA